MVRKRNLNVKDLFPSHFFLQATENRMEDDIMYIKARQGGGHQRKKAFYINRIETQKKSQNLKHQVQFLHVCFSVAVTYLKV